MWSWELAWEILPALLRGFEVTLKATFISFGLALVLGAGWEAARRASSRWVSLPARWGLEAIRSTPLLVQLYFLYYALPQVGLRMPALLTGVLGLGLHYSTYIAEIYRSGIDGVPRGQWEAGVALSLSRTRIWLAIVLPQAIPPILPALGNRLIALFKETPLLAAITVAELLLVAREIGDERFTYLEPYTEVGVLFLVASLVSSALVTRLEKRLGHA